MRSACSELYDWAPGESERAMHFDASDIVPLIAPLFTKAAACGYHLRQLYKKEPFRKFEYSTCFFYSYSHCVFEYQSLNQHTRPQRYDAIITAALWSHHDSSLRFKEHEDQVKCVIATWTGTVSYLKLALRVFKPLTILHHLIRGRIPSGHVTRWRRIGDSLF